MEELGITFQFQPEPNFWPVGKVWPMLAWMSLLAVSII